MSANVYAKLFTKALKSSIMRAPFLARAVFMHILLLSKDLGLKGLVPRDHFYLARVLAIPEPVLEEAIAILTARDEYNADDEFEGRRLVAEGEFYRIVNWSKYQSDPDPTHAARQRRYRENQKANQKSDASLRHGDANGTDGDASQGHRDDGDLETKRQKTGRAQKRTGLSGVGSEKPPRKSSTRDAALRSIVASIATTRPAFAEFSNWTALSKLFNEFGAKGLTQAAESVPDWGRIDDVIAYLAGICRKQIERGSTRTFSPKTDAQSGANWG